MKSNPKMTGESYYSNVEKNVRCHPRETIIAFLICGLWTFRLLLFMFSCFQIYLFGVMNLVLLSLSLEGCKLCRLALRETPLRLFQDLSSSFGSACVLNLGEIIIYIAFCT